MNIFIEIVLTVKVVLQSLLISMFRFVVPPARKSVQGDIVLITGSGHGLGRGLALEFAKLGARLVLWDINEEGNLETAKQILEVGGKCHCYTCDVGDREAVYRVGRLVQREVGEVYILVNNAGIAWGGALTDIPDTKVEDVFKVNLLAQFWTVKQFLPSMLRRNHGHVVNVASSVGLIGISKLTEYSASKFGVVGFTEVLNYELTFAGYSRVHTTLVCPSVVNTGMFSGCRMRFPWLLSPLETPDAVTRITTAILTNQNVVCLPRIVYFFSLFKTILPVAAFTEIIKFFGCSTFMDTYSRRHVTSIGGEDTRLLCNAVTNGNVREVNRYSDEVHRCQGSNAETKKSL